MTQPSDIVIPLSRFGNLCLWVVTVLCFYYPIAASLIVLLEMNSTPINMGIRFIAFTMSAFLIVIFLINRRLKFLLTKELIVILVFWIFYSLRLVYDLSLGIQFGDYDSKFVYGFAFGNILAPLLAIICWYRYMSIGRFMSYSYVTLCIGNILMIYVQMQNPNFGIEMIFNSRAEFLMDQEGGKIGVVLNAISVAYYGELLAILSVFHLLFTKKFPKFVVLFFLIVGSLNLIIGGSRGPLLGFLVTVSYMLLKRYWVSSEKMVLILKSSFYIIVLVVLIILFLPKDLLPENFKALERLSSLYENLRSGKGDVRIDMLVEAYRDFIAHPVFGKRYLLANGWYPHNLLVEAFMATGILGGVLFFSIVLTYMKKLFVLLKTKDLDISFLLIITIPIVIGSMFSSSLFQAIEFWLLITLFLCFAKQSRRPQSLPNFTTIK